MCGSAVCFRSRVVFSFARPALSLVLRAFDRSIVFDDRRVVFRRLSTALYGSLLLSIVLDCF